MAAPLVTEGVFEAFLGSPERAFYYGHSYCGNPLGAAIAREVLRSWATACARRPGAGRAESGDSSIVCEVVGRGASVLDAAHTREEPRPSGTRRIVFLIRPMRQRAPSLFFTARACGCGRLYLMARGDGCAHGECEAERTFR